MQLNWWKLFSWFWRSSGLGNCFLQCLQLFWYFNWCSFFEWKASWFTSWNDSLHSLQTLTVLGSQWFDLCWVRFCFWAKPLPHFWQVKEKRKCWFLMWLSNVILFLHMYPHSSHSRTDSADWLSASLRFLVLSSSFNFWFSSSEFLRASSRPLILLWSWLSMLLLLQWACLHAISGLNI